MSFVQKNNNNKKQKGKGKAGVKAKYSQFLFLRHIFVWRPWAFLHIWLSGNKRTTDIILLQSLYHNYTFLALDKSFCTLLIIFPTRNAYGAKNEDGRMRGERASNIRHDTTHQQKKKTSFILTSLSNSSSLLWASAFCFSNSWYFTLVFSSSVCRFCAQINNR